MKRILSIGLLLLMLFAFVVGPVLAYVYYAPVTVTENGTGSHDMAAVGVEAKNEWMADNGFMEASALDTRIETFGGLLKPHMVADNTTWFATAVPEDAQTNLFYTTGSSLLSAMDITYGSDSYLTISDDTTIELGLNDFSLYWGDAWIDTNAGSLKFKIDKPQSFQTGVSSSTDEQIDVLVFGMESPCLDFVRGNTDWVRVPDDDAFSFTDGAGNDDPFTVLAWVNFDDASSSCIIAKSVVAGNQWEWIFQTSGVDVLSIDCRHADSTKSITAETLAVTADEGTWHHYAATYDGTELNTGLEVFRDGINATNARAGVAVYTGMSNTGSDVSMGAWNVAGNSVADLQMAEVKIYSAELTQPEIEADFNGGHRTADLVAWWRIDEGVGLPQDSSGNAHHTDQNLADWVNTFTNRYTIETYASNVASGEYDIEVAREDEPTMSLWATDVNIGVNMGNGLLPVKILEEITLDAPAASVTFTGISGNVSLWDSLAGVTSRHLVVMVNAKNPDAITNRHFHMRLNGDAGGNYNFQRLSGEGTNPALAGVTTAATSFDIFRIPAATTDPDAFGGGTILFPHAFNTVNNKSLILLAGSVEHKVVINAGRWADNSAITSILVYLDVGDFDTGSTFLLGVVDERYLVEEQLNPAADFSVDFQNIPADGHDLVVVGYSQSDLGAVEDEIIHELNNDGGAAAYPVQELTGRAGAAAAFQPAGDEIGMTSGDNAAAEEFGAFLATYSQYAEATNQVHFTSLSGYHESTGPTSEVRAMSGRWANVAAITRLELYPNAGGDFKAGSLFSLYRVPHYVIDRQELTAATPTITFATIPQNYQALQLNVYARSDDAIPISDEVVITVNADNVDANYNNQELEGTGAGPPTATRISGLAGSRVIMLIPAAGELANEFGGGIVTFNQYTNTLGHKHFMTLSGTNENQVILRSSRWANTDAITSIVLDRVNGANFIAGSVFELVGLMPTQVLDIEVDGEIKGLADGNFDVPDTDDDWKWGQNNVMPYSGNFTQTVDGTTHAWYEPNYMVSDTRFDGTADAGSTASLIRDAELTQANDYWNNARVTILTTTDTFAPQGETRIVTDFLAATDDLIVDEDFTAVVDAGDTYRVSFGTLIDRSYYGVEFDGDTSSVTITDAASIQNIFDGGGTIEGWVYIRSDGELNQGRIFSKNWMFDTVGEAGGFVQFRFYTFWSGVDGQWATTVVIVPIDQWVYFALTYNSDAVGNDPIFYINDATYIVGSGLTEVATPIGVWTTDVGSDLILGNSAGGGRGFDGIEDEMRTYTRILGSTEVTANYNTGVGNYVPYSTTDLDGWWHMELGTGATVTDTSGNGNDGTITTATWANGFVPRPANNSGVNDGRITWGINPTGITVALGSMMSSSTPAPGADIEDPTIDILPAVDSSDWFIEPDVAGVLLTNPLRPFVTMLSDNSTLTELQAWRLYALAIILLVTVSVGKSVRGHHLITGIAAGATIGGVVALTIFPFWTLVFIIGTIFAGAISERSPTL